MINTDKDMDMDVNIDMDMIWWIYSLYCVYIYIVRVWWYKNIPASVILDEASWLWLLNT